MIDMFIIELIKIFVCYYKQTKGKTYLRSWYESIADSNTYELLIIYRLYYPIIYRSYPKLLEETGSLFFISNFANKEMG